MLSAPRARIGSGVDLLARLFEHNNRANDRLLAACARLDNARLDARPAPRSSWSVRDALTHLVEAQQGCVSLLTRPPEARNDAGLEFRELRDTARASGERLRELAADDEGLPPRLRTTDGYVVEPWVVLLQAVNHATDHRRQIGAMLRAESIAVPRLDGWAFGEAQGALRSVETREP